MLTANLKIPVWKIEKILMFGMLLLVFAKVPGRDSRLVSVSPARKGNSASEWDLRPMIACLQSVNNNNKAKRLRSMNSCFCINRRDTVAATVGIQSSQHSRPILRATKIFYLNRQQSSNALFSSLVTYLDQDQRENDKTVICSILAVLQPLLKLVFGDEVGDIMAESNFRVVELTTGQIT